MDKLDCCTGSKTSLGDIGQRTRGNVLHSCLQETSCPSAYSRVFETGAERAASLSGGMFPAWLLACGC